MVARQEGSRAPPLLFLSGVHYLKEQRERDGGLESLGSPLRAPRLRAPKLSVSDDSSTEDPPREHYRGTYSYDDGLESRSTPRSFHLNITQICKHGSKASARE